MKLISFEQYFIWAISNFALLIRVTLVADLWMEQSGGEGLKEGRAVHQKVKFQFV